MPKQTDYTLTDEELGQILAGMKSTNARTNRRALVVHSLHLGYSPGSIATMQKVSLASVYNYHHRFQAAGVAGLTDQPKPGRPPKATEAYRERLRAVLETDPQTLGFAFAVWTLPSLQAYLQRETGIKLSQNRLSAILQEEGYVYRRPKKDLRHKQDASLREAVKAALDELKKAPPVKILGYSLWTKVDSV
jgi:transposase